MVEFCCSRIKTKREDLFSQQAASKLQAQPVSSYQNPEKNNNNNKTLKYHRSFFGRPGAVVTYLGVIAISNNNFSTLQLSLTDFGDTNKLN